MNNNNPPTAQIIDFDNYDPFSANGNNNNNNNQQNTTGLNNNPVFTDPSLTGQTTFSPTGATRLPGPDGAVPPEKSASIFSINYYRMFFNVQGDQVLQRAMGSFYPQKGHLEQNIGVSPDLYGPIWIAVTLVVSSAISHGIAQFIQNAPHCVAVDTDMRRTSFVASAVFLYAFLLPAALWAFLKYQGVEHRQTLPSYMCLYGYSMVIFIPVSIIWVIRMPAISWPIMLGATIITGYSLVLSLWPSLQGLSSVQARFGVAVIVVALHLALAISLGAYAFEPTLAAAQIAPPVSPSPAVVANAASANASVVAG